VSVPANTQNNASAKRASNPSRNPSGNTGGTFRSLKYRNFRLFFIGQFVSQVGNWLTLVTQALLAFEWSGHSGFAVGVLSACQFVPVLMFGAYGGVVSDRSDRRRLLMLVQFIAMLQSFGLAIVALTHGGLVWLDGVAVVSGCTMAFDNPARRTLFVELVDAEDVNNAVGLNSSLMTSSRIIGPAIASILIATVGYAGCFTADAVSYLAVLIGLAMMRPHEIRSTPVVEKARGQIRAGWQYTRRSPELWIGLLMMAVVGTLAFNFQVVLPVFVEGTFRERAVLYAVLFAAMSFGSLAGALVAARRVEVEVRDVATSALFFGVAMLVFAAAPTLAIAFPLSLGVGFTSITFLTASTAIVQLKAAPEMRGRVLALQAIVFLGTTPIGGPIMGVLCDAYGARAGIIVGGLSAIAAGAFGIARSRVMTANPAIA
jgi:MFS family permease